MENDRIADHLDDIADLLELDDGNEFRVRAYRTASRRVREHTTRLVDLVDEGSDLTKLSGIGASIADDIRELVETGSCQRLRELRQAAPEALPEIMHVRGLGARKARKLYQALGVRSLQDLARACREGRVREIPEFGAKTEENILKGIAEQEQDASRVPLKAAADYVESLARHLEGLSAVQRWVVAGSFRRRKETVGDLDVIVQAEDRKAAMEGIGEFHGLERVVSRGREKSTLQLDSGLRVDFRFFEPDNFGAALMYFTGSKAHNVALRRIAKEHDWKLSEYGLAEGDEVLAARTEEDIYQRFGLVWIPPELREDRGEIDAAADDALPELVALEDIRGDLHCHTRETDGEDSLQDMVRAARDKGYAYMAVTDHSRNVSVTQGMDEQRLRRHAERIRKTNAAAEGFRVLAGIEVDILKSGELDLDLDALADLDWVVASVHSYFDLSETEMTRRLLQAVESGVVHCLGHPLCRQIGRRGGIHFDAEDVFRACAEQGVCLEVNANPTRLDLPNAYCKLAREHGASLVINTDAHRTTDLDFMSYGIDVARRGWLEAGDVLNTRSLRDLERTLEKA